MISIVQIFLVFDRNFLQCRCCYLYVLCWRTPILMIHLSLKSLTCTRQTEPSMKPLLAVGRRSMPWDEGEVAPRISKRLQMHGFHLLWVKNGNGNAFSFSGNLKFAGNLVLILWIFIWRYWRWKKKKKKKTVLYLLLSSCQVNALFVSCYS